MLILSYIYMKLKFKTSHKSIRNFNPIDLKDFSIFTGKNGSGKTHLLQAMKNGNVTLDTIKPDEIVYFDLNTFKTYDTKFKTAQNRMNFVPTAYESFKSGMRKFRLEHPSLTDLESTNLNKILDDKNKALLDIDENEINNIELWKKIKPYQDFFQILFKKKYFDGIISSIIKKSKNFVHDISLEEFKINYVDISSTNQLILTELGMLFYDYQIKLYEIKDHVWSTADKKKTIGEIEGIVQDECNARFGGMPPWEAINKILESYSDMNHELIEPQKIKLPEYRTNHISFPVVIKEKSTNTQINPEDLSSGETVLFALALSVFREKLSSFLPKVLLLDEIDATLHPSMMKNLLRVIDEIFVKKGTKVILATHSPTTIALCEEESIFVIDRKDSELIKKQSKREALFNLTDGFVSIEEGLHVFDQIGDKEITIISEGNNAEYIQKAMEIFAEDNKDKISIILTVKDRANDSKLKTLFDFFVKIEHTKKIIFVWDSDCEKHRILKSVNNTHPYVFPCNSNNKIISRGIENLFDEQCFDKNDYTIETVGDKVLRKKMYAKRKDHFKQRMITNATKDSFKNFKHLFEHIDDILKSGPK